MPSIFSRYGTWLACCLSRGPSSPLSKADLTMLSDTMGANSAAGGTFVFREGDEAARIHVVSNGSIELSRLLNGRRVTLQILGPGDVFGDVPALLGAPEPFDARAVDDSTLLSLDAEALFALLQTRPAIARRWFVSMAERMAGLQSRLIDLLAGGLEAQLASLLLRNADAAGAVKTTQKELAAMLGVQRSSVQRVLKDLEAAALIDLGYRRVTVNDAAGLASLVDANAT